MGLFGLRGGPKKENMYGFDKKECVKYFVVSLIENIGYLHLNPHLADEILPAVEFWREFYVHPLVAKRMLSKVAGVPASIVRGVADSHERIDGTGFPRMAAKQEMTAIALHTGLIDELTRLRFSRGIKPSITIREAMAMLQFRRAHFCDHAFATLNGLILSADLAPSPIAKEEELVSFARLQLVYYTECLVYCDVVARIADSSSLESNSKSIERLHLMCKGFIKSVFASGMLSQPIWRLIEECANNKELELLQDMMEIDHAHHGILDRLHEIFLLLEYILEYEEQPDEIAQSAAFLSLNGCWAFFTHLKSERERSHIGWQSLIDKMYDGDSYYTAMSKLYNKAREWGPACWLGYNSIKFDEKFLRMGLYKSIYNQYITNTNGSTRADLLPLMHYVKMFSPNSLSFPLTDEGKPIFKLDRLAPSNNIPHEAHRSMGDVVATLELSKLVKERCSDLWNIAMQTTKKIDILQRADELVVFCYGGFNMQRDPDFGVYATIGANINMNNELIVFNLSYDLEKYLSVSIEEGYMVARFNGESMPFLARDVITLPIANTTVEEFSQYFLARLLTDIELTGRDIDKMVVTVASSPGQSGSADWSST